MVLLTNYLVRHELKPLERFISLQDILVGAQKVAKGLAIPLKPPVGDSLEFYKVKVGRKGAGRMVVFCISEDQAIVPVLIRLKKDKVFGMNMAMNNPVVEREILKNMQKIRHDIDGGLYTEIKLA